MRIGYGYGRRQKDFAHVDVDRLFLDAKGTDRAERIELFKCLRAGDTLVLLYRGDLARGVGYERFWERLEALPVTVEEVPPPAEKTAPGKPGPRPVFDPNNEQRNQIAALWYRPDVYVGSYVVKRASEITGIDVTLNHLNYRFGKRSEPPADFEGGSED